MVVWNRESVVPKLSEDQRALAIAALADLRLTYNKGDCKSIYDEADEHFRLQPSGTWSDQCNGLHDDFGVWQGFNAKSVIRCSASGELVCISGSGSFTNGDHSMETILQIESRGARLVSLSLQVRGNEWIAMPRLKNHRLFLDPLPNDSNKPA
jgi:hypothetical protein